MKRFAADTSKIFSSYELPLIWYEHDIYKVNENLLRIKRFIDKRIRVNFEKNNIPLTYEDNPWDSLIDPTNFYTETSFKYVIDHTFYKPRDLILFFKPLSDFEFKIPLKYQDVNNLLGKYASEAIDEISNELTAFVSITERNNILKSLNVLVNQGSFSFTSLLEKLNEYHFFKSPDEIIELMFNYSLIGNKDKNSFNVYFKHREGKNQDLRFNKELDIVIHHIVKIYLLHNMN